MTEQQDREPRLLAFICNWAYYTPYEQAEVRRAATDGIRIVRVPCSGRVNPQLLLSAVQEGYDAVVLVGCAPEACHYREGSRLAQQRLETLRRFLPTSAWNRSASTCSGRARSPAHRWLTCSARLARRPARRAQLLV